MENVVRPKMPPAQRAKQFMPFAAVKGLEEALALQEIERQEKVEPDAGVVEAINRALTRLSVGEQVQVCYFCKGSYTQAVGSVTAINEHRQYLEVDGARVYFEDIHSIRN
ncbi:MAG: hypothetical protein IJK02_00305 [Clostridia bacterium]|nr:hypothetical protein [Clostridia bacterium]